MFTNLSACGIECAKCDAYLATQANDLAAREEVARKWQQEFNAPQITADTINCDGCMAAGDRHFGYCLDCEVRKCAVERQLENCAHCPDYVCEKLAGFFQHAPQNRATLDLVRQALAG